MDLNLSMRSKWLFKAVAGTNAQRLILDDTQSRNSVWRCGIIKT